MNTRKNVQRLTGDPQPPDWLPRRARIVLTAQGSVWAWENGDGDTVSIPAEGTA